MSRSTILEAMYEVIKESTEWGLGEKDYGQFVDGVVSVVEKLLEKEEALLKLEEPFKNIGEAAKSCIDDRLLDINNC